MKALLLIYTLLAIVSSCDDESDNIQRKTMRSDATYVNNLAVDGCSWHFSVSSGDSTIRYAPSVKSVDKIDQAVGKIETVYDFIPVTIEYSLTGKKQDVKCGWGMTSSFDEIDILSIQKR